MVKAPKILVFAVASMAPNYCGQQRTTNGNSHNSWITDGHPVVLAFGNVKTNADFTAALDGTILLVRSAAIGESHVGYGWRNPDQLQIHTNL